MILPAQPPPRRSPRTYPVLALLPALLLAGLPHGLTARPGGDPALLGPRTEPVDLAAYARVLHVSAQRGDNAAGDGSPARPWASLQAAIDAVAAPSAAHRVAVLVESGTYQEDTLRCRPFVDLYGGFGRPDEPRDIFAHPTILDGRATRRVLIAVDDCRLDGFIFQNGRAFGDGGALLCDNASPVVSNNRFFHNHTVMPPEVRPDRIHQNGHRGGAIAILFDAAPHIRNNLFWDNFTEFGDGGALSLYGWTRREGRPQALVENNVFLQNRSGTRDYFRTRSSSGGAIACSHEVNAVLRRNLIAGNQALGRSDAGGVYIEYYSSPHLLHNWLLGNIGDDDAGAIYTMRDGDPLIEGNLIAGNTTTGGGVGGVRLSKEGRLRLRHNVIVHNLTRGGVDLVDGHAVVEGNLIAHNQGGPGLTYRQTFDHFRASTIRQNRVYGNEKGTFNLEVLAGEPPVLEANSEEPSPADIAAPGATLTVAHSDFEPLRQLTVVRLTAPPARPLAPGRVVRFENTWSLLHSVDGATLTLWGNFSFHQGDQIDVLPDYR